MDRRRLVGVLTGLAFALGIAAGSVLAADQDVTISGFSFSPRTVTVRVGDTVTWTNDDAQAHTATSGSAWNTGDIASGRSESITFRTAGTYDYICAIHPTMTGRVVVRAAGATAPPTDTAFPREPQDLSAPILALLGLAIVIGTIVADRHLRHRRSEG
jgi:plastocyanin